MEEKEKEYRIYTRVTPELYEKFENWAARLGLTKSQFANICIQAGMGALVRAISPEEAFSPKALLEIIKEAEKQGRQLDFSDFIQEAK